MNFTNLRTFVHVADLGSFTEAARTLGISQPAVTMQIQTLEASIGTPLIDRRYRRVDLTEAGQLLLGRARTVLAQIDEVREEIAGLSDTVSGHLVIGASTTPGDYVVPRVLGGFLAANPQVSVAICVSDTADVIEEVESGRTQLGVTGAMIRGARVSYTPLGSDELLVICPPDSPLASRSSVDVTQLTHERWVLRESGSGTRLVAESVLAERGVDPAQLDVAVELGTGEAIVSAVEGGLGIAMLSRYVASRALRLGTVALVDVTPATRPFYAVTPKGSLTRAAAAFLDHLRHATAPVEAGVL
jgi:DNA-binding transcriptional LysR family regulator